MSTTVGAAVCASDRTLGGYRIVRPIGCGGMATLLLARKEGPAGYGQSVALKVMHPHLAQRRELVELFANEARLGAHVNHPNVCRVLDFDRLDDRPCIVLEYLRGETLGALLDAIAKRPELHPLRVALSLGLLIQACEGLHAIHEAADSARGPLHIVHCDVSPDNLLVGYDGGVRVLDLGIARSEGAPAVAETLRGRPAYAAPEQVRGRAPDRRADVWALGVILQEALAGEHPLAQPTLAATLRAVTRGTRRSWPAHVPPALRAIADRALSLEPSRRFASARALGDALTRYRAASGGVVIDAAVVMRDLFGSTQREVTAQAHASDAPSVAAPSDEGACVSAVRMKRPEPPARPRNVRTRSWHPAASAAALVLGLCVGLGSTARFAERTSPPGPATLQHAARATGASSLAPSASQPLNTSISAPHPRGTETRAPRKRRVAERDPKASKARASHAAFGTLVLGGSRGWAVVHEGKRLLGTTPLRVALSSGVHTLQVRPYGEGVARRITVSIRASEVVRRVIAP